MQMDSFQRSHAVGGNVDPACKLFVGRDHLPKRLLQSRCHARARLSRTNNGKASNCIQIKFAFGDEQAVSNDANLTPHERVATNRIHPGPPNGQRVAA